MNHLSICLFFGVLLLICSCNRERCAYQQSFAPTQHLTSLEAFQGNNMFIDSLKAHPGLIIDGVVNNKYDLGMSGFQVYKGLRVFTSFYQLHSGRIHPGIFWESNFLKVYQVDLTPVVSFKTAIQMAIRTGNFRECATGELGIYDNNAGTGGATTDFRLVWQFESGSAELTMDAHTGEVLRMFDGVHW